MSAGRHDREWGTRNNNRAAAYTLEMGGKWIQAVAGRVPVKWFCIMTRHGRVIDKWHSGYRPGEIARDNRAKLRKMGWL